VGWGVGWTAWGLGASEVSGAGGLGGALTGCQNDTGCLDMLSRGCVKRHLFQSLDTFKSLYTRP